MHYCIEHMGMDIEDFDHVQNDEEARAYADARYTHYDDLVCVTEDRRLGGKADETEQVRSPDEEDPNRGNKS